MEQAQAQGFQYFDKTTEGYVLVRKKFDSGWALAIVRNASLVRNN